MRQKRAKSYKKQMIVYDHAFRFRAPYQVLLDNEIITVAENAKIDLVKYLKRTLQDEVKPMISQCAIYALYDTKNEEAIALAKSFERRRCGHKDRAIEPSKCMESIVNIKGKNKHRYVVVSQDVELRRKLRKVAGVPLVYMNRSVMVLEPLSDASSLAQKEFENSKLRQGLNDIDSGKNVPEHSEEVKENAKKRKGPKEPNPLSIKRKQAKSDTPAEAPKRKRKRKSKGTEEVSGEGDAEENQQQQEQKSNNETDTE